MRVPSLPSWRLPLLLLLLVLSWAASLCAARNVLLVIVDDLRPTLGAYGHKLAITPNIDSLAARGVIFNKAYAQQALCGPSRNSFLTSRRPDTTRLYDFYSYWRTVAGNFTTLPQYFKEAGYHAYSVGKIFHPGISSNGTDDMPYSWSAPAFHPSTQDYANAAVCFGDDGRAHKNLLCPVDIETQPEGTLPDLQSADEAVRFLNDQDTPSPFFLAMGVHKPHVPFKFPSEYLRLYPLERVAPPSNPIRPKGLPDIAWNTWSSLREREDIAALNISLPFGRMPTLYSRKIRQHYYAAVTYADQQVGRVLEALSANGLANDTLVVVLGDHGWSLGEHQEWAKFSNLEVSTRVPWIIHDPSVHPTLDDFELVDPFAAVNYAKESPFDVVQDPVELLDLFPTLADLAGLAPVPECPVPDSSQTPLCTEGRSLAELVRFGEAKAKPFYPSALSQYPRPSVHPQKNTDQPRRRDIRFMGYSLRTKNYRYTEWVPFDISSFKPDFDAVVAKELYAHVSDPGENHNRASNPVFAEVERVLSKILHERVLRKKTFYRPRA